MMYRPDIDIWGTTDAFQYLQQPVNSDVDVAVFVVEFEKYVSWSKGGLMIRDSLAADSKYGSIFVTGTQGLVSQWRLSEGASTSNHQTLGIQNTGIWLRIKLYGNRITSYYKLGGEDDWQKHNEVEISMEFPIYVGIAVSSHRNAEIARLKGRGFGETTTSHLTTSLSIGLTETELSSPLSRGVRADGSWVHPNYQDTVGRFFSFNRDEWEEYFDFSVVDSGTTLEVKQCRGGVEIWRGAVIIWPSLGGHGRRVQGPADGQWGASDYVVKPTEGCLPPAAAPDLQRWTFSNDFGTITNVGCPNLAISSSKEKDANLNSIYFALQNPRTQLAIGTSSERCTAGMTLEMQELVYGSPSQQFLYIENESMIVSLNCPNFAITIPNGDCSTADGLYLSNDSYDDDRNKWSVDDDVIQSLKCPNKYITIYGALSGRARTVSFSSDELIREGSPSSKPSASPPQGSLPTSPKKDANKTSNTISHTNTTRTTTVWDNAAPPSVGSVIILSDLNAERYQKWAKQHQVRFIFLKFEDCLLCIIL